MTMQNATMDVASRLLSLLRNQERSARWLARQLNVHPAYIQRRISGDVDFSVTDVANIARVLNSTVDELVGESA